MIGGAARDGTTPEAATRWWVSWYELAPQTFEYHGPWWVSGWRFDEQPDGSEREVPMICAAVFAHSAEAAMRVIVEAHDEPRPVDLEWRFVSPRAHDWDPWCDRFARAGWMKWPWPDDLIAACREIRGELEREGVTVDVEEWLREVDGSS